MSAPVTPVRVIVRFVLAIAVLGAALFGAAGTLAWLEAWLYLLIQFAFSGLLAVWLKRNNPDLLAKRLDAFKSTQPGWDRFIIILTIIVFIPYLILPGLEAVRFGWSQVPPIVKALGFAGVAGAFLAIFFVMRENTFLSRVVEIQAGQKVISTGPYRIVRHPMYAAFSLFILCLPLALGSYWALIPAVVEVALLAVRAINEEQFLRRELAGYAEYAQKVRFRMLPGVW